MNIKGPWGNRMGFAKFNQTKKRITFLERIFFANIFFRIRANGYETLVRSSKREENHSGFCAIIRIDSSRRGYQSCGGHRQKVLHHELAGSGHASGGPVLGSGGKK